MVGLGGAVSQVDGGGKRNRRVGYAAAELFFNTERRSTFVVASRRAQS
jgi:hypothetical protein